MEIIYQPNIKTNLLIHFDYGARGDFLSYILNNIKVCNYKMPSFYCIKFHNGNYPDSSDVSMEKELYVVKKILDENKNKIKIRINSLGSISQTIFNSIQKNGLFSEHVYPDCVYRYKYNKFFEKYNDLYDFVISYNDLTTIEGIKNVYKNINSGKCLQNEKNIIDNLNLQEHFKFCNNIFIRRQLELFDFEEKNKLVLKNKTIEPTSWAKSNEPIPCLNFYE